MMPAAMQLAAKSMNMTMSEFTKQMELGKISVDKFMPAFTKAMREMAAPGLAKAMKTMNIAFQKMQANGKLLIDAIFQSGVGELFTDVFNMLSDVFTAMQPVMSMLFSFLSTIIRTVIFPLRLLAALFRDIVVFTDHWLKNTFGVGLNEIFAGIGKVAAYIASIFFNVFSVIGKMLSPLIKAAQWLFGKSAAFKVGKATVEGSSALKSVASQAGSAAKAGGTEAARIAQRIAQSERVRMGVSTSATGMAAIEGSQKLSIEFTGEAKDNLRANERRSSTQLNVNSRG